ncbi:uncharacterized protein LOC110036920 [Phalaenopsis equestris]|uniref:uncharacterized protein LOC110036920 n=1 Tax=Phalaenopsis equestris TaxID=78828 RepID=UPI0009E657B9|nr:uncharacterized protein LOC110036920 [Phalaenopsis equestris]
MGEPHVFVNIHPIPSFCRHKSFMKGYEAIHDAIRRSDVFFLRRYLKERAQKKEAIEESLQKLEGQYYSAVNLSGDPLLSVLISYRKTELANKLLEDMDEESLLEANLQGNTALHVAAAVGNKMMGVADRLIRKNKELLNTRNKDNETPLLKAALHGQRNIFWMMYERGDRDAIIDVKRKDGANVLHCAIMGNAPRLALEIAESFPHLRRRRNAAAVTPLQLMVTIPGAFKSKLEIGPLDSFIYNCIPFNEGDGRGSGAASAIENAYDLGLEQKGFWPGNSAVRASDGSAEELLFGGLCLLQCRGVCEQKIRMTICLCISTSRRVARTKDSRESVNNNHLSGKFATRAGERQRSRIGMADEEKGNSRQKGKST